MITWDYPVGAEITFNVATVTAMNEELEKKSPTASRGEGVDESAFHVELVDRPFPFKKVWFWGAVVVSVFGVWFIYKVTFTDVSKNWLPYTEERAQLLVPDAPDGKEPIELLELTHTLSENEISIQGKLKNRTQQPIEDLLATITLEFIGTLAVVERDVAVEPAKIGPGFEALFRISEPVTGKLSGYSVKFKLANGAIVRHKDSRFVAAQ